MVEPDKNPFSVDKFTTDMLPAEGGGRISPSPDAGIETGDIDELKRHKMKRQNLRNQFTRSFNKFKNTLSDEEVIDVALGQGLYENLTLKFKALQEIENLVQKFTDIEKLQGELLSFSAYESKFEEATVKINTYKAAGKEESRKDNNQKIKFPTIKLEPFSGKDRAMNFLEWQELFLKSSEHLSQTDRLLLLKSLLRPPASSVLAGVRISEASYDIIWEKLFKAYGSDKLIINKFVKKLLLYQSPTSRNSMDLPAKVLRRCYDELNGIIRNLLFVKSDILTSERILVELLLLKTPQSLQIDIELSDKPKEKISDFFLILDDFVSAREAAELNSLQFKKQEEGREGRPSNVLVGNRNINPNGNKCIFCSEIGHFSRNCFKPKVPEAERFGLVWKNKLCSYCLMPGHIRKDCPKTGVLNCRICKSDKHATALHNCFPTGKQGEQRTRNYGTQNVLGKGKFGFRSAQGRGTHSGRPPQ